MVWAAAPGLAAGWFALLLAQGAIPAAVVYTTKRVVDSANAAIGGGLSVENVGPAAFWGGIMVVLVVLQRALSSAVGYIQTSHSEYVQDQIRAKIHQKAVEVDYAFYESEDYHNKLQHSNTQAGQRALSLLQNIGSLLRDGLAFTSIAALLAVQYAWWLPLALLGGTLPALAVLSRHNRLYNDWWRRSMSKQRWADYLNLMVVYPDYAAEVRLFGAGRPLAEMYQDVRRVLRTERLDLLRRQSVATFGASFLGLLTLGGVLLWVARRAFGGPGTLGDLALFYQALNQGLSLMRSLMGGVGQAYANTLFLEDLFYFLDIQPAQADPEDPVPVPDQLVDGIRFEDVTFTYPGATRPSLRGLDLHLPNGKVTAIVGENGAGKSTLVKLLCRFYEIESGRVLLDGTDLREFERRDLLDHISVLFQNPVHYQAAASDNIRLADLGASDQAVVEAARQAGAHEFLSRLPKGLDTKLGKMFYEGGELSGGQWQRVALARAYLRQSPIIALDEPTSAMDSWSEMEWFERFRALVEGRTAVVITHRFTVAMQADVIHVMDAGRVIETGTHRELLDLGGRYAESWREQTRRAEQAEGPRDAVEVDAWGDEPG
ncbi:ABC transporter ATP-binding protein [Rubrivirga sp.]|uniref:ABC transporter ATP-binding protein n=1 Tax=Rubrivirga sp. TaxID=1885344 RepID=UPI003B51887B